ncbi:hypothetical protein MMC17_010058 [Xylographa soralifera]|nr:hypothetical protein [Xylographa soralifera]
METSVVERQDATPLPVHEQPESADPGRLPRDADSAGFSALRPQISSNGLSLTIESDHGELDHEELSHDEYNMREEDVQSVLGVSIGREQTRLMSPTTPAAEKVAAVNGLWVWGSQDDETAEEEEQHARPILQHPLRSGDIDSSACSREPSPSDAQLLPSPLKSGPRIHEQIENERLDEWESPQTRSRSSTGPTNMLADLNIKRFWASFSLPSLGDQGLFKDFTLPRISSMLSGEKETEGVQQVSSRSGRSTSVFLPRFTWSGFNPNNKSQRSREVSPNRNPQKDYTGQRNRRDRLMSRPAPLQLQASENPHMQLRVANDNSHKSHGGLVRLRRTASEQSLPLRSAMSRISSLGDDSRWVDVHGQVNSRMKAIKDSFQDSALKLPSLSNINFSAFRPDFTHKRNTSDSAVPISTVIGYPRSSEVMNVKEQEPASAYGPKPSPGSPKAPHHNLHTALNHLTGDIVIMGGYRGSILRSAEPPHRQLWVPVKVGLNIRKVNLEVGLEPEDEETMENTIFASGMLTHIGPVDISRRLLKKLRHCKNAREGRLRIHDYGYDWRLSPHLLSRKLEAFLRQLACNQAGVPAHERGAIVVAHSLGGVITRHVVNQDPSLFAGVVYAGVPQHCVNILGPLRNGDEVLLSSRVLTAQVNFTLRTSFVLLPESGQCFIDKVTNDEYHVDFFNIETWKEYAFSPCIAIALPPINQPERKGLLGSVSVSLPALGPRKVSGGTMPPTAPSSDTANTTARTIEDIANPANMQMGPSQPQTSCILPPLAALAYLERTLAGVLAFKHETAFKPEHASSNSYPPVSILYSTSVPTVYGARVDGRAGIRRADAYDDLAFASGDGVVLARAAMLPRGYTIAKYGKVRTERGHVGLLGDLEGVGKCLLAVARARRRGVGMGVEATMSGR